MKKSYCILLPVLLLACQQTADPAKEEAAINDYLQAFASAWNAADGAGMAATYTEDGALIDPFGTEARGREVVQNLLAQTVTSMLNGSTTSFKIEHIRWLGHELAFVDATQTISGATTPEGMALPEMAFHVALAMVKKGNRWLSADARPYQFMPPPGPAMSEK